MTEGRAPVYHLWTGDGSSASAPFNEYYRGGKHIWYENDICTRDPWRARNGRDMFMEMGIGFYAVYFENEAWPVYRYYSKTGP